MSRSHDEPERWRPRNGGRARRTNRHVIATIVALLVIAVIALFVGTLLRNVWLLIAAPTIVMIVGIWGVAILMTEP